MPALPPTAFISYSRVDADFARKLACDLETSGVPVWLDLRNIPYGRPWDTEVENALATLPRMLLILSPASAKSDNVRNEISYALDNGKLVIPVMYQACEVPLRLRRIQYIDFRNDYHTALEMLVAHLALPPNVQDVERKTEHAKREKEERAQREAAERAAHEAEIQRLREDAERFREETERLRRESMDRQDRERRQSPPRPESPLKPEGKTDAQIPSIAPAQPDPKPQPQPLPIPLQPQPQPQPVPKPPVQRVPEPQPETGLQFLGRVLKGAGKGILWLVGTAIFGYFVFVAYKLITNGIGMLTHGSYLVGLALLAVGLVIAMIISRFNK